MNRDHMLDALAILLVGLYILIMLYAWIFGSTVKNMQEIRDIDHMRTQEKLALVIELLEKKP